MSHQRGKEARDSGCQRTKAHGTTTMRQERARQSEKKRENKKPRKKKRENKKGLVLVDKRSARERC